MYNINPNNEPDRNPKDKSSQASPGNNPTHNGPPVSLNQSAFSSGLRQTFAPNRSVSRVSLVPLDDPDFRARAQTAARLSSKQDREAPRNPWKAQFVESVQSAGRAVESVVNYLISKCLPLREERGLLYSIGQVRPRGGRCAEIDAFVPLDKTPLLIETKLRSGKIAFPKVEEQLTKTGSILANLVPGLRGVGLVVLPERNLSKLPFAASWDAFRLQSKEFGESFAQHPITGVAFTFEQLEDVARREGSPLEPSVLRLFDQVCAGKVEA